MNQIVEKTWTQKPTRMGYGIEGLKTIVDKERLVHYFKKSFTLDKVQALNLKLTYDDGCIIYINGKELKRFNMPEGEVGDKTTSKRVMKSSKPGYLTVPSSFLQEGRNMISISVHNKSLASSDLVFGAELETE